MDGWCLQKCMYSARACPVIGPGYASAHRLPGLRAPKELPDSLPKRKERQKGGGKGKGNPKKQEGDLRTYSILAGIGGWTRELGSKDLSKLGHEPTKRVKESELEGGDLNVEGRLVNVV